MSERWFAGESEEYFVVGPLESEGEAAEEFAREYPDEALDGFVVGIGEARELRVCGESILDTVLDDNDCLIEGWADRVTPEQAKVLTDRLTETFRAWCKEHKVENPVNVIEAKAYWKKTDEGLVRESDF